MAYKAIGANNGTSDGSTVPAPASDRALFLKKLATDVLRYFQLTAKIRPMITNRSIDSGKSEAFPIVGNAVAFTKANDAAELSVEGLNATEREILIGDMTVAQSWITDLDDAMVHYDAKAAHTESIGRALGKKVEKDIIVELVKAGNIIDAGTATAAGLLDFSDDIYSQKSTILIADIINGAKIYTSMVEMVTEYVDKDIVGEPAFMLRPNSYFSLLNNPANTGLTWVNDAHAQSGKVPMVMGKKVFNSAYFPTYSGALNAPAAGDCQALLFAKEAVGVLELLSVSMRSDYIPMRLANLTVGKMALGYGILNHSTCIPLELV